jgi:hypothetical protein
VCIQPFQYHYRYRGNLGKCELVFATKHISYLRTPGNSPTPTSFLTVVMTAEGSCSAATASLIKANQEAYIWGQTGVQSATATVTCSEFQARRRRRLLVTYAAYNVTVQCTGTGW